VAKCLKKTFHNGQKNKQHIIIEDLVILLYKL